MSAYAMIAYCLHKGGDVENACLFFEKGLHVCRMINGDFTETTAYSMIQLSDAYLDCDQLLPAITNLEHAITILS